MAIVIFTVVNGMGVAFLLYVLVQFWKEGHRSGNGATRRYANEFSEKNRPQVIVVTHPISGGLPFGTQGKQVEPARVSHSGQAGLSVVSMQGRESSVDGKQFGRDSADRADEMRMKRFSTR